MPDLYRYDVDQMILVFQNDTKFNQTMVGEEVVLQTIVDDEIVYSTKYRQLAELLLENEATISASTIDELNAMVPSFLRVEMVAIYDVLYISEVAYKQTLFTFKYGTVQTFFKNYYQRFLPDYEYLNIQSSDKVRIFQEAFMKEFDNFASIISEIYNVVDVDKVPEEYLNYLAQAIGYEREDRVLMPDASFRELIKNIVEIYRIKGTNYSFELFFNFLGFSATIKEYWFDKRFSDSSIVSNPENGSSDPDKFTYYLTSTKPTEYIPNSMSNPYAVTEEQVVPTLDINKFNKYISDGDYTRQQLLGITTGFNNQIYTFFKTNVIEYSIEPLVSSEEGDDSLTSEDLVIIQRYATFLTPIFLSKNINVIIPGLVDYAPGLILSDDDSIIESPSNPSLNKEVYFMQYQGLMPSNSTKVTSEDGFKWGNNYRFYNDPEPQPTNGIPRTTGNNLSAGGIFPGGQHNDTYSAIYDPTPGSNSVYSQLEQTNPTWDRERILLEISTLITADSLFFTYDGGGNVVNNYSIGNRDLISPFIEQSVTESYNENPIEEFTGTYYNFVTTDLTQSPTLSIGSFLSDNHEESPLGFTDDYNKVQITNMVKDNGSGRGEITISDSTYKFKTMKNLSTYPLVTGITGDFTISSQWIANISDISNIVIGQKIYLPYTEFGLRVIQIDRANDQIKINRISSITSIGEAIELYSNPHLMIEVLSANDRRNNGAYKVYSKTGDVITLMSPMKSYGQKGTGGFIKIYDDPWTFNQGSHSFLHEDIVVTGGA